MPIIQPRRLDAPQEGVRQPTTAMERANQCTMNAAPYPWLAVGPPSMPRTKPHRPDAPSEGVRQPTITLERATQRTMASTPRLRMPLAKAEQAFSDLGLFFSGATSQASCQQPQLPQAGTVLAWGGRNKLQGSRRQSCCIEQAFSALVLVFPSATTQASCQKPRLPLLAGGLCVMSRAA